MIIARIRSLSALGVLGCAFLASNLALAQAPTIVTPPANISVASGSNATLTVQAAGAQPLAYRWQLFGTNLPNQTNATLALTNVNLNNGGLYAVVVTNSFGAVTSAVAVVNVDEDLTFRIIQLQTNGAIAFECNTTTGDDRGGLVVGRDFAYLTGDNSTARFSAGDLIGALAFGFVHDSLCSDLRTEKLYALADGTNIILNGGGNINALLELEEESGLPNGQRINLSTNISMNNGGIFSGYGRVVLWNGSSVFDIALPSGRVTPRGNVSLPRTFTENWACWGLAEYFTNTLHLVYVQNDVFPYRNIVRSRVGQGSTPSLVSAFTSLGDLASMSFSLSRSRWYFHYEGSGQFRNGDETMGSAKALFSTNGGVPYIIRGPVPQTNYPGSNATLSVVAAGNGPFTYQWRFNGNSLPGANESTLVLSNLDFNMTGNYSVEVGNDRGGATSGDALVFVVSIPQILTEPQTRSVSGGASALFTVVAQAAPPVSYQWLFNGTNILNATNATHVVSAATAADVGDYRVVITNRYGSVTSAVARLLLIVESAFSFRIVNLGDDSVLQEHSSVTGDDRGGLVVSSNRVFVGGDLATGIFSATDLSNGTPSPTFYDALVSDLRTERVYSLGDRTNLFRTTTSTVVTTFIEINGSSGVRTTNIINLSQPIPIVTDAGLFSGYGQVVIHTGTRVFSVALPSGVVADLGPMSTLQHQFTETWAYWGLAENFGGSVYLAYVQNNLSIVRARVPDGLVTSIANFLGLSDMASIGASVSRGRWYFHHEGVSQFGGSNQTVGFCSAAFSVTPNQVVDHFTWEPLPGAQFSGVPFSATITARTLLDGIVSNFSGTVTFTAFSAANGAPVSVSPASSGNFSNGVWTGPLVVPNAAGAIFLRATDLAGRFGVSSPFSVVTTNDLALVLSPSTNAATLYKALTYHLLLTNSGPETATSVFATNTLPANVNLISVTPSQGSCGVSAGIVVCDVGTMLSGQSVNVQIEVVPTALGTLTNISRVVRGESEAHPENNAATNILSVTLPKIIVSDVSAVEGDIAATRGTNVFTVQLNTTSAVPVYVQFATAPGTATNASDYVSRNGLITFAPGMTSTNIRVTLGVETVYEANEIFFLNLFNVTNALLVRTQAVGTIINDDPQPTLVVSSTTVTEADSGTALISIPVRLSSAAGVPITMNWASSNGTAVAGSDFLTGAGLLRFTNGSTNLFISMSIVGDLLGESNEFFYIRFFNGTNIIVNTQILVTILNDDPANVLHHFAWGSIAPTQELDVPFTVSLTAKDVVDRTLDSYNSTVRLSSGSASGQRERIIGDVIPVDNFSGGPFTIGFEFTPAVDIFVTHVRHISGTKVSIWKSDGTLVVAQNVNSINGTWIETPLAVPVRLTAGTAYRIAGFNGTSANPWYFGNVLPQVFNHGTLGNSYYESGDFFPIIDLGSSLYLVDLSYSLSLFAFSMTPTNVTFTNGTWSGPVRVQAPGDNFRLFATDNNIQVSSASEPFDVLLVDDLALEIVPSANPVPMDEHLVYSITVSNAGPTVSTGVFMTNWLPSNATYVSSATDRGSVSRSGSEVVANIGTLTNGEVATVFVVVFPSGVVEITNSAVVVRNQPEVFLANNRQTNVVFATDLGLYADDVTLIEGHSGTTNAVFHVNLTAASTQTVSVAFSTQNSSATTNDYRATNGVLVFAPGVTSLPIVVPVLGDLFNELNEQFLLVLSQPTNSAILQSSGTAVIINDDALPMISVSDVTVEEGRNGLTPATFILTLSQPSGRTISLTALTINASAVDSEDFVPTNRIVTIAAGQTSVAVTILVRADNALEPDEFFLLRLASPANATLAVAEARATILNDDGGAAGELDYFEWSAVSSPQTVGRPFNVTITARDGVGALFPFTGVTSLAALAGTNVLPIWPSNTAPFVNGAWSGTLTFSNAATNVVLVATDEAGHDGFSDLFDVNVADLGLIVGAPPQVLIGSPFNYTLVVSNLGPNSATAIVITNRLPPEVLFVSANSSGGGCVFANGVVRCDAGSLAPGQIALVSVSVNPLRGGSLTNQFFVSAFEHDLASANNLAVGVVEITGDEDGDGLPDTWESQNGLSSLDPTDAQRDPDRDGHTSLQEFLAGTDPQSADSILRATLAVNGTTAQVRFQTVQDKRYVVERAGSPAGPWASITGELLGDGDVAVVFDSEPVDGTQRFYRVHVLP